MRLEPGSPKPAEGQGWRAVCPGASGCSGLGTSRPAPRCGAGVATHASGAGDKKEEPLPAFLGVCTEADVAPGLGRWLLVLGKPAGFPWVVLPLFRGNFCWWLARGGAEEEQPSQPEIWAVPHGGTVVFMGRGVPPCRVVAGGNGTLENGFGDVTARLKVAAWPNGEAPAPCRRVHGPVGCPQSCYSGRAAPPPPAPGPRCHQEPSPLVGRLSPRQGGAD